MSKTEQWSPRDDRNPYRVWDLLTVEEWRQISRWYPFSMRVLATTSKPEWRERARCETWDQAREIMQLLAQANKKTYLPAWVVMKCSLVGKEGRERPVLWYPSQGSALAAIRDAGLYKIEKMRNGE